jgi:hypothetical protein
VVLGKDLSLEFSLREIQASDALAKTLEFAIGQLPIEEHVKLSENFFYCSFQVVVHFPVRVNEINFFGWGRIGALKMAARCPRQDNIGAWLKVHLDLALPILHEILKVYQVHAFLGPSQDSD